MLYSDVKAILGITATTYDNQIKVLLPIIINSIEKETNSAFKYVEPVIEEDTETVAGYYVIPIGLEVVIANDIKNEISALKDVSAQSLGDYSVSYAGLSEKKRSSIINSFLVDEVY